MGGVLVSSRIASALASGSGSLGHGQTYQAHPVACAAALEVQRIIAEEDLLSRVQERGRHLRAALDHRFAAHPHIGDIRGRGLFQAIELVADRARRDPFPPDRALHSRIKRSALDLGLAVYPSAGTIDGLRGDHVLLAPPYTSTAEEIELIVDRLGQAVDRALASG
jgi:adenosylmethionine-8-amino-7-oxononanoate aminotransferase